MANSTQAKDLVLYLLKRNTIFIICCARRKLKTGKTYKIGKDYTLSIILFR